MLCESYKQALTDAAAANVVPSDEVSAHLSACRFCRAFFVAEQQLFAAIDCGVDAAANHGVPASLLPRVRARLDERPLSNFSWFRVGALLAGAALVLVSVLMLQKMRLASREAAAPANIVAESSAPKESPAAIVPEVRPETQAVEPRSTKWNHPRVIDAPKPAADRAVLVPAGQREAVDNLLAALSRGTVKGDDLLVKRTASGSINDELAPLGIPAIEIKPLAAVSEDSAPTR
jgi:hypothetical protein